MQLKLNRSQNNISDGSGGKRTSPHLFNYNSSWDEWNKRSQILLYVTMLEFVFIGTLEYSFECWRLS